MGVLDTKPNICRVKLFIKLLCLPDTLHFMSPTVHALDMLIVISQLFKALRNVLV